MNIILFLCVLLLCGSVGSRLVEGYGMGYMEVVAYSSSNLIQAKRCVLRRRLVLV